MLLNKHIVFFASLIFLGCGQAWAQEESAAPLSFPVYGNWCGPDHPADPASAEAPVDGLDAMCMQHDLCYESKGYLNCECDAVLVKDLKAAIDRRDYENPQALYARHIHNYFQASRCDGDPKDKLGPSGILQRVYNKARDKAVEIYDHLNGDDSQPPAVTPDNNPASVSQDNNPPRLE